MNYISLSFLITHLLPYQDSGRKCWGIEILAQILQADSAPAQCQLRRNLIERLECYPHTGPVHRCISHFLCLLPPLRIVHKLVDGARCTPSIQQISHWHTRQPISGSVEDGCHGSTSWAMLPHDLRCDASEPAPFSLLCTAASVLLM